jgi:hypothetical protein
MGRARAPFVVTSSWFEGPDRMAACCSALFIPAVCMSRLSDRYAMPATLLLHRAYTAWWLKHCTAPTWRASSRGKSSKWVCTRIHALTQLLLAPVFEAACTACRRHCCWHTSFLAALAPLPTLPGSPALCGA